MLDASIEFRPRLLLLLFRYVGFLLQRIPLVAYPVTIDGLDTEVTGTADVPGLGIVTCHCTWGGRYVHCIERWVTNCATQRVLVLETRFNTASVLKLLISTINLHQCFKGCYIYIILWRYREQRLILYQARWYCTRHADIRPLWILMRFNWNIGQISRLFWEND